MEIRIEKENYGQLVQCVYLGNLVINEYRKEGEVKSKYSDFLESILKQVVKTMPRKKPKFKFCNFPNEKSEETLLADLTDKIEDSVSGYYEEFRKALFSEMLEERVYKG